MNNANHDAGACPDERRQWMAVLAGAEPGDLEAAWEDLSSKPAYEFLRAPQTGLAMVRGRVGGSGRAFNLGEMTMTRCVVRLDDGATGYAYVAGRDAHKAERAAVFDALLRGAARRDEIMGGVIRPLALARDERRAAVRARTEPTRVEFFTMVRGED
ncbi:phosphonate C-P lyase system protein PhnG [Desulfocurvus sp. DL9XJH121]